MINQMTDHAKTRFRQRGITKQLIDCLLAHGEIRPAPGGATKVFITKREAANIIAELKKDIEFVRRANGVVVVQKDGSFLTGYHKS